MINIIHGSSRTLARALRRAGPFLKLRNNKKRFTSLLARWNAPNMTDVAPTWGIDIFLAYPEPRYVYAAPSNYQQLHDFYRANKYDQWQILRKYFRTPEVENPPYVVRPLRHEGGAGFEIVNVLPDDRRKTTHYWRSLWERSCEYRVFFVRGRKVLTLLKRVPEGTPQNIPWNAGVSSFVTVHEDDHDRLRHSKFYEKAEAFFKDYPFDLCAVDVLYRQHKHRVVEVNFSPGVMIEDNLATLTQALLNRDANTNPSSAPVAVATRI